MAQKGHRLPDLIVQLPESLYSKPLHGVQLYGDGIGDFDEFKGRSSDIRFYLKLQVSGSRTAFEGCPIWSLTDKGDRYSSLIELYRENQSYRLAVDCEGKGSFEYDNDGIKVTWERKGTGPEHYFQSIGLAIWLEQQEITCIHANALAIGNHAIGILAPSQMGKTTMTAALMQLGCELMTDDMLALHHQANEWRVYPSWPVFRVWPDSAKSFIKADLEQLPRVHKRFEKRIVDVDAVAGINHCKHSKPIQCLYLLERRDPEGRINNERGSIRIEPIPPAQAMIHLLQNSMLGSAYSALGVEQERLAHLAKLLETVPVKKVVYSSGMKFLPAVSKMLLADASEP